MFALFLEHLTGKGIKMIDVKNLKKTGQLKDGTPITIRAVRPDDKEKINEAFKNLEPETIYYRYFRTKSKLTEADLKWATEIDFDRDVALVVTIAENGKEIIIGGSRYYLLNTDPEAGQRAEVAFTVEEDYHGQGIASRLLKILIDIARSRGLLFFEAEVLAGNKAMLTVFKRSGLPVRTKNQGRTLHVTMTLSE